jgi:site-specific DNA-methyltransferase (adenine-specific)
MNRYQTDTLDLRLMDCMELMREFPDKHFDLACIDPPYGIGEDGSKAHTRGRGEFASNSKAKALAKPYKPFAGNDKNPPSSEFFTELFRVSKNQIVWGANHFIDRIGKPSPCWIVWDKLNEANDFADCELAWTSYKSAVRKFEFRWQGMLQGDMKNKEQRIHACQKPVALYRWLLANYAKEGMKILDTHLGSMSSCIAAHYSGVHLTGCELDPDYFAAGIARVKRETAQLTLF